MSPSTRVPSGIPAGGQFAPTTHAEPELALDTEANRFAHLDDIRSLDCAASASLRSLEADTTAEDESAADKVRDEWRQRRDEIATKLRRKEFSDYARRREDEALALLASAARADLRNVADELRIKHPTAARVVLTRNYDDGNLAICVESVQDIHGAGLDEDVVDTAQELVSEYSSRQMARFVDESPIDLASAAAWNPPGRPGALFG
ncbi:hypothetical protein GCM10023063_18050 [Arthrobacter methylotrophus]|uniref:DUF222 domain-containing protein n=1 Tax=Arthrobacter methylotrophus TaxID=121291 RepID=A0ABV5UPN1_9MICC